MEEKGVVLEGSEVANTIQANIKKLEKIHLNVVKKCKNASWLESMKKDILKARDLYSEANLLTQMSPEGKSLKSLVVSKWTAFCSDVWSIALKDMQPYYVAPNLFSELVKVTKWLFPVFGRTDV